MAALRVGSMACVLRSFVPGFVNVGRHGLSRKFSFSSKKYLAISPRLFVDLKFTEQHEWVRMDGPIGTVGITAKAAESMGDLVYVEIAEEGLEVEQGDECGSVESVKAVSDIYAPVSGKIVERNTALSEKPDLVNKDPYGEQGWLFRVELSKPSELDSLLTEDQYTTFVKEGEE